MSVGWLKVRQLGLGFGISGLLILACLFEAKRSSDYRNTPWSYNLQQNHENEANPTPAPKANDSLLWLKGYFMLKILPLTDFRVHDRRWNLFALVVVEEQEVVVNWKIKLILKRRLLHMSISVEKTYGQILYLQFLFHMRLVSFDVRSVVTLLKCKLRNELLGF